MFFDQLTKSLGGRLHDPTPDMELSLEFLRRRVDSLRSNPQLREQLPPIHVDIIDSPELGARAFWKDDHYCIGIKAGTFHLYEEHFLRLMSTPIVLPELGNSSVERGPNSPIGDYYLTVDALVNDGQITALPVDDTRRAMAHELMHCALRFMLEHEMSHILFGHLRFIATRPRLSPVDYQIMELQADITATIRSGQVEYDNSKTGCFLGSVVPHTDHGLLRLYYFSVCSALRLLGHRGYEKDTLLHSNHPPTRVRQNIVAVYLHEVLAKKQVPFTLHNVITMALEILLRSEKTYSVLTNQPVNSELFNNEYFSRHPIHRAIHERWDSLQDLLHPYSYKNVQRWGPWVEPKEWST